VPAGDLHERQVLRLPEEPGRERVPQAAALPWCRRLPPALERDIERALSSLADAPGANEASDLFLVGGGALAHAHDARRTTRDVDAIILGTNAERVLSAARALAGPLGLPERWLNDDVKRFILRATDGPIVFPRKAFTVRAASTGHLLAMKLAARRDEVDIADARLLLGKVPSDLDTVWSLIGGTLPESAPAQARYYLEDLYENLHGPR